MNAVSPDGRYIGTARLGPKSQIVIPKEVRDMFGLEPGSNVLILADPQRGIAIVDPATHTAIIDQVFAAGGPDLRAAASRDVADGGASS